MPTTAHDIAVHVAGLAADLISDQRQAAFRDSVIEHGIELTDEPGVFTIDLENGQRFHVQVVEPATLVPFVLHDEPALRTVTPDSDRPRETDEVWNPAASYQCAMRHATEHAGTVGWREHEYSDTYGADHITQQWVPFYEIQLPGDAEPQRFCEDCATWITVAADHVRVSE